MFQKIREAVEGRNRFLVATHIDPDGDALGTAFAFCFALTGLGKDASVYLPRPIPYRYRFLPAPEGIVHEIPVSGYDAAIVADCGDLSRVGDGHELLKNVGCLINVDHHEANEAFGQINIIDERASSSAEIAYLILKALDVRFTYEIAINIYAAVLTDTGSFRYDSTTQRAFRICEEMIDHGVLPSYVAGEIYESHPKERYLLLCLVLGTLEFFAEDRIATIYVTEEMFEKTGTNRDHTEGFVEYIKEIRTVEVACMMRQVADNRFKVSMRSKGGMDVASIARRFGGGGHQKAAGCTIEGSIEEARNRLIEAFSL
jgi:bifunctional oligoribonuclease and PAP phosphatase NrnA